MPTTTEASAAERRGTSLPVDTGLTDTPQALPSSSNDGTASHIAKTTSKRPGAFAKVTGIRHWSTPNYTRVAIDLGDDVTYEAARVPNPDRIYFDLHGTRLAQELVGKSFTVTDDGFLKRIRAAQFSNDMTRVVLDVNDVTEYSAFLLPNPYRLVIDIHGGPPTQSVASAGTHRLAGSTAFHTPGSQHGRHSKRGKHQRRCGRERSAGKGGSDQRSHLAANRSRGPRFKEHGHRGEYSTPLIA
jgi:N-acetylmuramoyl-L-alanine amidase